MLEVLNQDYIRTAKAKGLREKIILYRHALKNSLLPIIALAILRIPWLVGGAVITESVFSWPGIGTLMIDAIYRRDFPVVQGIIRIIVVLIIISDIIGDIIISLIDPRVRLE
jgi:peptide/nickel transport system permease protein